MSTRIETSDTLEELIDRDGLYRVTEWIAAICGEKAKHLRSNWQDESAAKRWDRAARAFDRTLVKLHEIQIP